MNPQDKLVSAERVLALVSKMVALRHGHDELHAAISDLPTSNAWRDIAEAPKDGTRVLLFDKDREPSTLIAAADKFDRGTWWGDSTVSGKSIVWRDATHWQPLPPAPANVEGDGR